MASARALMEIDAPVLLAAGLGLVFGMRFVGGGIIPH